MLRELPTWEATARTFRFPLLLGFLLLASCTGSNPAGPGGDCGTGRCPAVAALPPPRHCGDEGCVDVVIVLDTSRSTVDPWPDPHRSLMRHPSYLTREVETAREILASIALDHVAVGLVTFAGEPDQGGPPPPPARTEVPLTNDFSTLDRVLDQIGDREPDGSTHLAAAIDRATIELLALRGAESQPRTQAERAMVILTDGVPTLPHGPAYESENIDAARRALSRAKRVRIKCYVLALGMNARLEPLAPDVEATGGWLALLESPGEIPPALRRLTEDLPRLAGSPE